jgi:hypothetical protein
MFDLQVNLGFIIFVKSKTMLPLTDLDIWKQLENPYGNSVEIPSLIERLENSFSLEILDEICWEYIYHQNSLYEATFATIPYLISICEKSDDPNYNMTTFFNIGVILSELDVTGRLLSQTFAKSAVDKKIVDAIIASYVKAFEKLKTIGHNLFDIVTEMDEDDKRCFLAALATAYERYDVAKVFSTYSGNDEYMCTCPDCGSEFYLWNKGNRLILYLQDPVFNEEQPGFSITPIPFSEFPSIQNITTTNHFEWLCFFIDHLEIQSLKPVIGYLFGETECPECNGNFNVFEAVSDPLV